MTLSLSWAISVRTAVLVSEMIEIKIAVVELTLVRVRMLWMNLLKMSGLL